MDHYTRQQTMLFFVLFFTVAVLCDLLWASRWISNAVALIASLLVVWVVRKKVSPRQ
jgi:Flp pilus assembly protein TadB